MMIKELNLCCTGSIAIIAIPQLILTLRLAYNTQITVFLSNNARRFITEHTFQALTGNSVYTETDPSEYYPRISGNRPTLVAPATANAMAAIAVGLSRHLAARVVMQSKGKVFIAPATNRNMWAAPATQNALRSLERSGYIIIGPETGREIADLSLSQSSLAAVDSMIKALLVHLP